MNPELSEHSTNWATPTCIPLNTLFENDCIEYMFGSVSFPSLHWYWGLSHCGHVCYRYIFPRALKFPGFLNSQCVPTQNCLVTELRRNEQNLLLELRDVLKGVHSEALLLIFAMAFSLGALAFHFLLYRCH